MNSIAIVYIFLIIVGIASIANLVMAFIDYLRTKTFRLVYIPPEARPIDNLSTFAMVLVVIVFILDIMHIVRAYTGFYALFVWVLFDDLISIYFRYKKWQMEKG